MGINETKFKKVLRMKHFSLLLLASTSAQIFMHSPRGSQNRIRERSAQNENENRLFWANHNNDYNRRGGYNTGEKTATKQTSENDQYNMQYFMSGDNGGDSFLTVEWTQVNGCGVDPFATDSASTKTHDCSVLIQSLCQDDVTTPPKDIKDTYTIKNGFNYDTINFEDDGSNLADPKGGCFIDQGNRDLEHFAGDILKIDVRIKVTFTPDSNIITNVSVVTLLVNMAKICPVIKSGHVIKNVVTKSRIPVVVLGEITFICPD